LLGLNLKYVIIFAKYLNLSCVQRISATFLSRVYVKYGDVT